jgi:large subunit ribosomal protein L10
MESDYHAKASQDKKESVAEFVKLIEEYPIIGAVNVENLPALQLNRMRSQLRGTVVVKMTKRRLITLALEHSKKKHMKDLIPHLRGMPALIFTRESPFKLYKTLQKNKSKAPIKAGQVAPNNIVVPAGPTGFAPGPIIGELGSLKIKAGIEGGKVAIKEDTTVAKAGDVISPKLAGVLTRLGIEPMEIGLNLSAVWENGEILTQEVLNVDEDAVRNTFKLAAAQAFNLAFNMDLPTTDTMIPLIQAAHQNAFKLAVAQDVMTEETKGMILAKAEAQARALKEKTNV